MVAEDMSMTTARRGVGGTPRAHLECARGARSAASCRHKCVVSGNEAAQSRARGVTACLHLVRPLKATSCRARS